MPERTVFRFPTLAALVLGCGATFGTLTAAHAEPDAGSYLAARQAVIDRSFRDIDRYARTALVSDPENTALLESLISADISRGDFDALDDAAERLETLDPGNQLAAMIRFIERAQGEDYQAILDALEEGEGISAVADELMRAWAHVGLGDVNAALDIFDASIEERTGFEFFGPYNKALATALVGDFEGALELLSTPDMPLTRPAAVAKAEMLSQLERNEEAVAVLTEFVRDGADPEIDALKDQLRGGETLTFDVVRNAKEGIADVFFSIALALDGGMDDAYTLLYARLAQKLRPGYEEYAILVADLLERLGNYELATEAYDTIPVDSPMFLFAELGRADALRANGKTDAEIEALRQLSKVRSEVPSVHVTLGDALRRNDQYELAAESYSKALDLIPEGDVAAWPILFTRGICYERMEEWDKTEADMRAALELSPEQPQVLNYLGYTFLELRKNLDEAMDMIRRASELRPDDGYITDSLAWGYYRLGQYAEAVAPMEHAAELLPVDPIINDHLGDIYWAVGREREARFQWRRALSFEPEEDEAERIRRKLEIGLDRVLVEEGEEPTRSLNDG